MTPSDPNASTATLGAALASWACDAPTELPAPTAPAYATFAMVVKPGPLLAGARCYSDWGGCTYGWQAEPLLFENLGTSLTAVARPCGLSSDGLVRCLPTPMAVVDGQRARSAVLVASREAPRRERPHALR